MAPSLTKAGWVRTVSRGLLAGLGGWTALELALSGVPEAWAIGGLSLLVVVACIEHGTRTAHAGWHRLGRVVLVIVFVSERLFLFGLDPFAMIAFVVLLIGLGVAQSLERTFAPVYAVVIDPAVLRMVDAAAVGTYARAFALLCMTFAISLLLVFLLLAAVSVSLALRAWLAPPKGTVFVGTFYYVDDFYNYLSYVEQAERGYEGAVAAGLALRFVELDAEREALLARIAAALPAVESLRPVVERIVLVELLSDRDAA